LRLVDVSLALPAEEKWPNGRMEKYFVRGTFEGFLPTEILWRKKEAFSDGVSSQEKSWYKCIQERVETKISDEIFSEHFPSKEAMYYKLIFDKLFPTYHYNLPYWLPRWSDSRDPSARTLSVYHK
jgi:asparagine synthase (glutamine-hydrolysing)